jgi:endonuclease/exonuclease/phosphatase family metal-dependent hydrolase
MKKILFAGLLILYFSSLASLLIAYAAPFISPQTIWIIGFFGLAYRYLLMVNLLFLFGWIIKRSKWAIVSLLVILLGWKSLANLYNACPQEDKPNHSIKVISYNVRNFDLYNWSHNKKTRNKIVYFFKKESPAILCLQEFFQGDSGYFETIDTLKKITQSASPHIYYTVSKAKKYHWGIATFSKYPIVKKGVVPFKRKHNNICIFSDIKIEDDTVRVYNLHLQSIHFSSSDYKFVETLAENADSLGSDDIELASKNILRRIKHAFIKRSAQAEAIVAHIDACTYPIIVCGDFNDTPFSYTYHLFSKRLVDSFSESGKGFGTTYIGAMPSFRIDYMMHSPTLSSTHFVIHPEELSDHYAISCRFKLKK